MPVSFLWSGFTASMETLGPVGFWTGQGTFAHSNPSVVGIADGTAAVVFVFVVVDDDDDSLILC